MKTSLLKLLRGFFAVVALLAGALALSTPSRGFTQNTTGTGTNPILKWDPTAMPIAWEVNPTPVTGVTAAQWQRTFKKAMRTWMDLPGSDLDFAVIGTTAIAAQTNDSHNVLYSSNATWTLGAGILALTNYIFTASTGILADTDMVYNGKDFTWSTAFADERANNFPTDTAYDLQSIMTHELGHSIGFGHSLDNTGVATSDPLYDDNGTVTTADDQINGPDQNTMDPATLKGETFQRSLAPDDSAAMDATYPAAGTVLVRPSAFVIEPNGIGDTPAGGSYTIQWIGEYEGPSTPQVAFYYTQNITQAAVASLSGATLIASGIASPKNGTVANYLWTFVNVPAGDYYIIAVVTADSFTRKDISPGVITVATPVLTLTAPTLAGITLTPYSNCTVTWTASGSDLGAVKIQLSLDSGVTFIHTVISATPNTGSYTFTVPDPVAQFGSGPQTQCRIRISYASNASVNSVSLNDFTIAVPQDSLTVTSPNGGEVLTAGTTTQIQFDASGPLVGDDFRIQFSPDLGANWIDLESSVNLPGANPRQYNWIVPGALAGTCLIRVESVTTRFFVDTSESPFTIAGAAASAFVATPASLTFEVMAGGTNPANQAITVTNVKAATAITSLSTVRSITNLTTPGLPPTVPASQPAIIAVALDTTGLSVGTINATVTIKGSGVSDLIVPVTINVRTLGTTQPLTYNPTSLAFTATKASLSPGAQTFSVNNPAGNVITTVDVTSTDPALLASPGRFTLNPATGQTLTVLTDTKGLAKGTVKHSTLTTKATIVGTGSFPVTVTIVGAAAPATREKNKASPCSVGDSSRGGGVVLTSLLAGLLALGLLRWRLARA